MMNLIIAVMVIGSCATAPPVTLQDHTTFTLTGQKLMLDLPTLGKQIEYSIIFGKPAKPIADPTECVSLKIDGQDSVLWHLPSALIKLPHQKTLDLEYCLRPVLMQKKCLPIK